MARKAHKRGTIRRWTRSARSVYRAIDRVPMWALVIMLIALAWFRR